MYSGLIRLLMQELYGRHFLAPFGSFDAIPDQDQPAIDPHRLGNSPSTARAHKAESRSSSMPLL